MPTIINADTSDGLKFTSDTSGEIKLQSGGTDIATVDSSGITAASGKVFSGDGSSLTGVPSLGVGQTWQNLTASRSAGVTYTNTTGNPIQVSARANVGQITLTIDSIPVELQTDGNLNNSTKVTGTVPDGDTYSVTLSGGSLSYWAELR
jgi:hypothetical protein